MREGFDCKGKKYEEIEYGDTESLTGKVFNKLTVLFRVKDETRKHVLLLCQCECGNLLKVRKSHLKNGGIKTCGLCYSFRGEDLRQKTFNHLLVLSFEKKE